MDGSLDAVVHFQVKLRELVVLVRTSLLDVSQTGGIDNVADDEALDGLILGDGLSSGNASHTLNVSAAVFVASVIASLDSHDSGARVRDGSSLPENRTDAEQQFQPINGDASQSPNTTLRRYPIHRHTSLRDPNDIQRLQQPKRRYRAAHNAEHRPPRCLRPLTSLVVR